MAYSGGFVYRNGVRAKEYEDIYPDWAYHHLDTCLGSGEIRLVTYKMKGILFVGKRQFYLDSNSDNYYNFTPNAEHDDEQICYGKVRGCFFGLYKYPQTHRNQVLEMFLVEPDGTIWNATEGFCIGSGFEHEFNATEKVVKPLSAREIFELIQKKCPSAIKKYGVAACFE